MPIREAVLSEDYHDFILPYYFEVLSLPEEFPDTYLIEMGIGYSLFLTPPSPEALISSIRRYNTIPKLFMLQDTTSLDASGITQVQTLTNLQLTGRGVLIGFIDTGIDYTNPVFQDIAGSTRIAGIWDQTIQTGTPPANLPYGSEYRRDDINRAIASANPQEIVPSVDVNGHGTFLASVAAGSSIPEADFVGAAPNAMIAMVKLKEAKNYLKEYFYFSGSEPVYQENDIMLGFTYLRRLAQELRVPLAVCIGLGSNQGERAAGLPLPSMLSGSNVYPSIAVAVAGGNEAGRAHHYYGELTSITPVETVEIQVPEGSSGFAFELWVRSPDAFSVGFISPGGEVIPRLPYGLNNTINVNFVLDPTEIEVHYETVQAVLGQQVILMRFHRPTPGVWRVRVYGLRILFGSFHMWLPVFGFTNPDIVFLQPDTYTTITCPSDSPNSITTATYDAYSNSLYLNSGRGNSLNEQKPDIAAPGVNLTGMNLLGNLTTRTGSSLAAALTAGCAALVMEWGLKRNPIIQFNSSELKYFLIRGAVGSPGTAYPNREWGYGRLNVYRSFTSFFEIDTFL